MAIQRRKFLAGLITAPILWAERPKGKLKISAVELLQLRGHRETQSGINAQYQVNPLYVYDEYRPPVYQDKKPVEKNVPIAEIYLRIRTDAGLDALYGPIDREAAFVVHDQLRPFLIGKDPLAGEALWDQMYRSNRHSRDGLFLMAISAVDNTLWDLRGRYFEAPVYRLLGGPTRESVEVYGSCLGYSLEPEKSARTLPGAQGGRLPGAEMVHGLRSGIRAGGLAEECRTGASVARNARQFHRPDVRRL